MGSGTSQRLVSVVGEALDAEVISSRRLGGGDVAESFRVELEDGRTIFAKTHRSPPPGFFTTEAIGLALLREPGAVPVPEVLAVSDGGDGEDDGVPFLALDWIDEGHRPPSRSAEAAFGGALARLHRAGLPRFGREDRRTTGSRGLPNDPCDTWAEFYVTQRLEPLRRLAIDAKALSPIAFQLVEQVIARVDSFGVPVEPPARLHGDLWAGNRLVDTSDRSWLIDPAAHGGHREFDLAMMQLFGGFGAECFDAYDDEHPLGDGWQQRLPLHQLAPLIVHAIKFGGGYRAATERALVRLLGR